MKRQRTDVKNMPAAVAAGALVSMAITVLGAAVSAWLILRNTIGEEKIGYTVLIITGVSAVLGSIMTIRQVGKKTLPAAVLTGVGYCLLLFAGNIVFADGRFAGVLETMLLVMGCSISVALLGAKKKDRQIKRKRRNG